MDDKSTQAAPVVETPVIEPVVEAKPVAETIGQVLDPKPEAKVVPEAAFLELKKENKEFKKAISALEKTIADGGTKAEVSTDIAAIGEKYGVDKDFLKDLATSIRKEADADFEEKLKPLAAKDKEERIENVFKTHFEKAMAEMPEYGGVVNRDVIKTLSRDPQNANKTFPQLIEETYGNALGGKRTIETTTPRGGAKIDKVDFSLAARDQNYLKEVLSNPDTKKEYNEGLAERLGQHM
jgi:hypothetical protein